MLRHLLLGLLGTSVASAAFAQSVPAPVPPAPIIAPTAPEKGPGTGAALSLEELDNEHGREGTTVTVSSNQNLNANNSGNSITADTVGSGDIAISEGAFAGFSGIGNFVVNSGHNNNLQGSLSITIVTP